MKSKSLKIFGALVLFAVAFTTFASCESTKTKAARESDPYFLADMDAIYCGELVALNKQNFFKPKPINIDVYFYPRTSSVGLFFKDGMNKVVLTYSPEEFELLKGTVAKYQEIVDAEAFQKNYKPNRKNRFLKGYVNIGWGTTGYGRNVDALYDVNYEWLEVNNVSNPYYRIEVQATDYPEEENVASPTVSLYFTPSQAKAITTIINMDTINQDIEDFNNAAYSFE